MAATSERASAGALTAEPLLTYKQLAAELNIPERRLRDWVYDGIVPCYRLGYKTVLFQRSRVQKALERKEIKAIATR